MTADPGEVRRRVDAVWKLDSARIVATLTRLVHDVGLAEELAQDALVAALEQWPATGVPDIPAAWLTTVARRRAVDHLRRASRLEGERDDVAADPGTDDAETEDDDPDDVLRLMFLTCHPALDRPARVALTLRLLGGLSDEQIARAFLTDAITVGRRVAAAKRALAGAGLEPATDSGRLASVLEVVYLVFNEGYAATAGDDLLRPELCTEALRLGHLLADRAPGVAEVHGLVALMELQASRAAARTGPDGDPVPLHEQDRGRWDPVRVRRGLATLLRAREATTAAGVSPGPYVLQAAIAACHAQARDADGTDWHRIADLYAALDRLAPNPVVTLNRAVAVGRAHGPAAGLALVDPLRDDPALHDSHLVASVRADLLERADRPGDAGDEYERAATLTRNAAERRVLRRRATTLRAGADRGPTLGPTVDDFLAGLAPATARSYGQTLTRLRRDLGDATPLAHLDADRVDRVCTTAWAHTAARTWNRHRAAVRAFGRWAQGRWAGLDALAGVAPDRRPVVADRAPSLSRDRVDALCADGRFPLRDRALWSLLGESGATVTAALALDVDHLDLDDRASRGAGGAAPLCWRRRTAVLLADLVAGRASGPLFLSDRRPAPARPVAPADRCAVTGRRRLSYERAEYLFKQATAGRTLRQLRSCE